MVHLADCPRLLRSSGILSVVPSPRFGDPTTMVIVKYDNMRMQQSLGHLRLNCAQKWYQLHFFFLLYRIVLSRSDGTDIDPAEAIPMEVWIASL